MPTDTFNLSNANFKFLYRISESRQVTPNQALNGILDDARAMHYRPHVRITREVQEGKQMQLFDLGH